ncbi:mucin-17-like isoform X2 [Vanessa atalanta]|uniref:mucin-17-like isoform X2 n=1 Tax=Vanessa atalanta TaxID=42275 RepID=UPI001FCD6CE5|nr:mucin-17-like isoform X2 [Vanessa atalanta]
MRGVWWSAFALLLLVVVTSAIRTAQVEGTSRISRRLPNPDRSPTSSNKSEDISPTSRSRVSRRREEIQPRDISRSRSRSRPTESPSYTTNKSQNQPERSDRFDSRRSNSRVRSKPVVNEENFDTTVNRENQSKSRSRQSSRYVPAQSTPVPLLNTSPSIGKIQKDFTDIAFNDITKTLSKDVGELNSQIRRRSSTVRTIESVTVPRGRGRINTRTNVRALDLDVSGTANALSTAPKEPTTARTEDIRNPRKLRYKTRQSETDTNLTGEGITTSNEVKSSQIRENITSQTESKSFSRSTTEKNLRSSTERISLKSSTLKTTKVVKRPVSRSKGKTPLTAEKNKVSDEIKEDDNYPEPFKALIQAKNASTQASSPPSESLSVKASQKVFKTHTTSSQSIITAPDIEKHSRLRSKINLEGNSSNSQIEENIPVITTTSEQPKPKSVEYRLRGSFKPRSKKSNTLSTSTISTASFSPSVNRTYKFQRKVKLTTTEASNIGNSSQSKSNDTNISFKKPALRSSLYLRRNVSKTFSANSEIPIKIDPSKNNEGKSILKSKQLLPRTSYYSRLRNGGLSTTSTTDSSIQNTTEDISIAEKKVENTAELPIIYTDGTPKVSDNANKQESRNFIITVNSKESSENGTELNGNEAISMTVESENKLINNFVSTTQKYHATYKDNNNDISTSSKEKSTVTPPIRNIRTRKYSRKSSKPREEISVVTSKSRERNSRKYSDTFSKTTEASSNGIIAGPEKQKNKFSSKYRASYLDKPFYKPTVPTITPSTVEGEEIQIGPDMNAISFTKSRSPLTSADLRLSESLAKSLQVMNVEASHHSPSVTVSIFDALAEILTSTPRPRISSTTEVLQKQSTNNDVKQINDGVSNNINVNSVKDSTSQDTFMSVDNVNTVAKSVQTTEQSIQDVFNRISVGGITTPSQNTKDRDSTPVTIPQNVPSPTPPPSTPISARKPFAIKVLYADTAPTTDKTTAVMTTNQPTTDSSTMVYNTVSDLVLSNNKLVSSDLTSMLSNNIKNIIANMEEDSRARLSVDMVKLLNSLIPKLNKPLKLQDDIDSVPNTTPYSLEDIRDTENIAIENTDNIRPVNILQDVGNESIVNSTRMNTDSVITTTETILTVNSTLQNPDTLSVPEILTTTSSLVTADMPIFVATESNKNVELSTAAIFNNEMSVSPSGIETILTNSDTSFSSSVNSDFTNKPVLVPFLTNFEFNDFTVNNAENSSINLTQSNPTMQMTSLQEKELEDIDNIEDPSQLSRLQLWILSKKARVLKMIEDIIRNHNNEIANAPLTELINSTNSNNISLSNRLSEIVNTMTLTTISPLDFKNENDLTSTEATETQMTTSSLNPSLSLPQNIIDITTTENIFSNAPPNMADISLATTPMSLDTASTMSQEIETTAFETARDIADAFFSTTPTYGDESTMTEGFVRSLEISDTTTFSSDITPSTMSSNNEATTTVSNIESATEIDSTTENNLETTSISGTESTTIVAIINETISNDVNMISNQINVATPSSIPKKDYVIFGILPNNTVVRKNPNDDPLETLTEASPYIIYGVLPNNTVIRKFPNGTRVPRIMQKIDILPISPWSLRNPYSPIHNIPAIVRPQSNPIRVSTNTVTSNDTSNNGAENQLTTDTVNNLQTTISSSALNITDSSSLGITTSTNKPPAEKSTASHVLSLRTTTMLPSIDEILLNSISSATKEEMVISSMTSTTREPRILTLDIDPETKQIRTEKPDDGNGNTVFKFIPIDEVTVSPQESNVLKLASTKMPKTTTFNEMLQVTTSNSNTQTLQNDISTNGQTSSTPIFAMTSNESSDTTTIFPELSIVMNNIEAKPTTLTPEITTSTVNMAGTMFSTANEMSTPITLTTPATTVTTETDNLSTVTTTLLTTLQTTSFNPSTAAITTPTANVLETAASNQKDAELLQSLLQQIGRSPKNLNNFSNNQQNDNAKLLQAILLGGPQNIANKKTSENKQSSTTIRSIEDDIRQFEEDTKLLKALLLATGRNPAELNLPNLDNTKKVTASTTSIPITTNLITTTDQPTTTQRTTTTIPTTTSTTTTPTTTTTTTTSTTTNTPLITTTLKSTSSGRISELSYNEDLRKLQEDTRLLQALLQATGNQNTANIPIISGITSNVRIASNPLTTSIESNPTTPVNDRPILTTRPSPVFTAITPETVTVSTLQPQQQTTEEIGISTTFQPFNVRSTTTVRSVGEESTVTRRPKNSRFQVTTEMPSTSTFSDEEDLLFLQNLKSVLSAKNSGEDPETALANRVIALAVERSLNEIQTGKKVDTSTTTYRPTTTTARLTTTTTKITTTEASTLNTPSIEEDIKQFEQDTKLLQALLKATGQDPSKFNIPTLTNTNRPVTASIDSTTAKPYGAKIAVKDELKNEQDDAQLLQTLIKLQDAQETTTQRSKIAITGQSPDEALKKLLNQAQPAGMVSEATKSSISLSTEFGNSNDALLAALLKEQGFGPTTASSLDEQLRLAALLNQVVVTPKARRTTTPPPPPPAPRRPVLDGLAWLWQQWRETAPGPDVARPNRRPAPSARPSITPSAATSSRVNWFGSGPFVGNADERPTSNRIPLEPPSAVTTEQGPGRGQLVSAAINVTRAFSQFLGAAIQGAAQTVQSVIRAGQRAASDAYTNGSG